MKNKNIQNGINEIKKISMTTNEKKVVLENIYKNSSLYKKQVQSPWFSFSFISKMHNSRLIYYVVIPMIIILASSGVVFASEGSLPDSILYPIKVNVVEPIVGVLTISNEAKAQYQGGLATKRLVEAETLAKQGKLDVSREKKINNLLVEHTIALDNVINNINKDKSSSSDQVDEIITNFQADMNAHAKILDAITNTDSNNIGQRNIDTQISNNARSSAGKIKDNTAGNKRDTSNVKDKYVNRKKEVNALINSTSSDLTKVTPDNSPVGQAITDNTTNTLNEAKQLFNEANNQEMNGDTNRAYDVLLDSERAAKEAGVFIRSGFKLNSEEINND